MPSRQKKTFWVDKTHEAKKKAASSTLPAGNCKWPQGAHTRAFLTLRNKSKEFLNEKVFKKKARLWAIYKREHGQKKKWTKFSERRKANIKIVKKMQKTIQFRKTRKEKN